MYGLQILLSIIVTFAVLIANMYMIYMVFVDINIPRDELFKSIIVSFIWCTYYTLKITKFSSICSYCVQQVGIETCYQLYLFDFHFDNIYIYIFFLI